MADLTVVTIPLTAGELKAGMTLVQGARKLLIGRIRAERNRVVVTTPMGDLAMEPDEEVEVRSDSGQPHVTVSNTTTHW